MRLRHPDGTVVHLAYCTNVHAAEDADGVVGQLARYAENLQATDLLGHDHDGQPFATLTADLLSGEAWADPREVDTGFHAATP